MRPKKKVNLKSIADAIGVSVVSVSNALSGKPGVGRELREKICAKADELGYEYRRGGTEAETLPEKYNISTVIVPHLSQSRKDRWEKLSAQLEREIGRRGSKVSRDMDSPETEGLILLGPWTTDELTALKNRCSLPMVVLGGWSIYVRADYVISDSYHAMYDAVAKLSQEGVANPGLLVTPANTEEERNRAYGLWSGLSEFYGMPLAERRNVFHSAEEAEKSDCDVLFYTEEAAKEGISGDHRIILCGAQGHSEEFIRKNEDEMLREAVSILIHRMKFHDNPEGVHYVQEISQIK